jgi:hypothetical protein
MCQNVGIGWLVKWKGGCGSGEGRPNRGVNTRKCHFSVIYFIFFLVFLVSFYKPDLSTDVHARCDPNNARFDHAEDMPVGVA